MAQTKRKRRTKHRGNAAGIVESRGKTHKGGASGLTAKEQAREKRLARMDKPPTWQRLDHPRRDRGGHLRRPGQPRVQAAGHRVRRRSAASSLLFYIPLGYFTDLTLYRRRQRSKQRAAERARGD